MNQEFPDIGWEQNFPGYQLPGKGEKKTNCRFYRVEGEKLCSWTMEEKNWNISF